MSTSKIEWTEQTWNPVTGCTKVSPGCKHCYAEKMHGRLNAMKANGYESPFSEVQCLSDRTSTITSKPALRKKPTTFFVNSMSDLFHRDVPFPFIDSVFDTIDNQPMHRFQILTKRADRLLTYANRRQRAFYPNTYIGVSVEDKKHGLPRIEELFQVQAKRFLSIEPLLEDLGEIDLTGICWVIVGGESGSKARPMNPDWVRNIRDQCAEHAIPFFFKQWGMFGEDGIRRHKKTNGRTLDGRTWEQQPCY